jgi:hypothetical protein
MAADVIGGTIMKSRGCKAFSMLSALLLTSTVASAAPVTTPAGPLLVDGSPFLINVSGGTNGGAAAISFDLTGYNSLDGDNPWRDDFFLLLNGQTIFNASFALGGGFATAPILVTNNTANLSWGAITPPPPANGAPNWIGGVISISGSLNLTAGNNVLGFGYAPVGPNNGGVQSIGDEGWSVENLDVSPVPVPPAAILLVTGLAGAAAMARRKKPKQST